MSTIIGAFLGFVFALIIYRIQNANARNKKELAEKEKAINTLKRFSLLLKAIVNSEKQQNIAI